MNAKRVTLTLWKHRSISEQFNNVKPKRPQRPQRALAEVPNRRFIMTPNAYRSYALYLDWVRSCFITGDIEPVNELIGSIDVSKLDHAISLVRYTYPFRSILSNWALLHKQVSQELGPIVQPSVSIDALARATEGQSYLYATTHKDVQNQIPGFKKTYASILHSR